jgi:hypothetical protein
MNSVIKILKSTIKQVIRIVSRLFEVLKYRFIFGNHAK